MDLFWWILAYVIIVTAFQVFLMLRGAIKYNDKNDLDSDFNPKVSILIPAYNEEKSIISCIEGALKQDYHDFEVLVIDDGSTDNTLQKVTIFMEDNDYENLRIIHKANGGKHSALNRGMEASNADWILAVDADSFILPSTISTLVRKKRINTVAMTAGIGFVNNCTIEDGVLVDRKVSNNLLVLSQMLEYIRTFVMLKMSMDSINGTIIMSGACSFFNKKFVQDIGGYRNRITEDAELTLRIHSEGGKVQFINDVLSFTEAPESVGVLYKQRIRWIRGLLNDMWEYKGKMDKSRSIKRYMIPYFYMADVIFPWIELLGWSMFIASLLFINELSVSVSLLFLLALYSLFLINNVVLLTVGFKKMVTSFDYGGRWKLYVIAFFDIAYYRPIIIYFVINAHMKALFHTKYSWGDMKRKGF